VATFVLVHGGWVGGWFWGRVRNVLRDAGHQVLTPTLTGLGERKHLGTPDTDLETHIADVVQAMEYEDVARVVLAGHGYAGMVITGVLDRVPQRVYHAAYIDAFVPDAGQSLADLRGKQVMDEYRQAVQGDGWHIPLPFKLDAMGITSEVDLRWMTHRLTPQPLKPFLTPLHVESAAGSTARTFIRCTGESPAWVPAMAEKARAADMDVVELKAPHYAPVTHPRELAALLQKLAPGA
jgi:pimeloyl-ACP methyl ester carboxylesterase